MSLKRKKRICKSCGKESYIWSGGKCRFCAEKDKPKKKKRNYAKKIKRKRRRKTLTEKQKKIRALDRDFSLLVRALAAVKGRVQCYTCGKNMLWKGGVGADRAENGHLFSRGSMCLRWDKRNTEIQCNHCNNHLSGNFSVFREKYIKDYGQAQYDKIALTFHQELCRYDMSDLEDIHKPIREELRAVLKNKGL